MIPATLFVVIDPTTDEQRALKRAEQLAVDTGARLHLFCCEYRDDLSDFGSKKEAKQDCLNTVREQLEALAQPLRAEGLKIDCEAYWNRDWQSSIVRAASRVGADLILKSSDPHSYLQRHLQQTSDFTLLRQASCAVLLVRSKDPWLEQQLLAAVTLDTDDSEHDLLNNAIITEAQRLAKATQSHLHCVTAIDPSNDIADVLKLLESEELDSDEEKVSERFGINPERVHIQRGKTIEVISKTAKDLRADVLIIGSVARKGISAMLIGNSAEKLIDNVDMDILIVN
jgi:universal stress protein E